MDTSSSSSASVRLRAASFLLVLSLLLLTSGCSPSPEPVRIASPVWIGNELLFLARSRGWLDEDLVTLRETEASSESLKLLARGDVDGATLTLNEVLLARQDGIPLTIILVLDISVGADVVLAAEPMANLASLRGMRVGFEHGTVGELMMMQALRSAGLDTDDIEAIDIPADRHVAAWSDGLVDVIVTYEPWASRIRAMDAVPVFDSREIPEYIVDVLAIRSDRMGRSRDQALRQLVTAQLRSLEQFQRNPQDAAFRMSPRLNLPVAEVLPAFRGLVLPDKAANHRLLSGRDAELLPSARALMAFKIEQGLLEAEDDLTGLVTGAYLPRLEP